MLTITIGAQEHWDNAKQEFVMLGGTEVEMEHSLVALKAWESKWEVPFLATDDKTHEMVLSYIGCMILTPNFPAEGLSQLTTADLEMINAYWNAKYSGTTINEIEKKTQSQERVSAELIYFWMDTFGIANEAEHWHLNQLFNRIRIHSIKNAEANKKPQQQMTNQQMVDRARLNAERRAQYNSRG